MLLNVALVQTHPPLLLPWHCVTHLSCLVVMHCRYGWGAYFTTLYCALGAALLLLSPTPMPVDDLVRRCQFSAAAVNAALSDLELAGRAELLPGHRACLAAEP